jgi:hypothetical protein
MVFLFQDQNQGTRNDESRAWIARVTATVLFHPDFDRRLRICTESADPCRFAVLKSKALAGSGETALTAGGDFRPALRTSDGSD